MNKQKKLKRKRDYARRRKLPRLVKEAGNKCHWCKSPIVMRRAVNKETIIQEQHGIITFFEGDLIREVLLASVDHLNMLANGGTNDWDNCVASCWFCNNERSNAKKS